MGYNLPTCDVTTFTTLQILLIHVILTLITSVLLYEIILQQLEILLSVPGSIVHVQSNLRETDPFMGNCLLMAVGLGEIFKYYVTCTDYRHVLIECFLMTFTLECFLIAGFSAC